MCVFMYNLKGMTIDFTHKKLVDVPFKFKTSEMAVDDHFSVFPVFITKLSLYVTGWV